MVFPPSYPHPPWSVLVSLDRTAVFLFSHPTRLVSLAVAAICEQERYIGGLPSTWGWRIVWRKRVDSDTEFEHDVACLVASRVHYGNEYAWVYRASELDAEPDQTYLVLHRKSGACLVAFSDEEAALACVDAMASGRSVRRFEAGAIVPFDRAGPAGILPGVAEETARFSRAVERWMRAYTARAQRLRSEAVVAANVERLRRRLGEDDGEVWS